MHNFCVLFICLLKIFMCERNKQNNFSFIILFKYFSNLKIEVSSALNSVSLLNSENLGLLEGDHYAQYRDTI